MALILRHVSLGGGVSGVLYNRITDFAKTVTDPNNRVILLSQVITHMKEFGSSRATVPQIMQVYDAPGFIDGTEKMPEDRRLWLAFAVVELMTSEKVKVSPESVGDYAAFLRRAQTAHLGDKVIRGETILFLHAQFEEDQKNAEELVRSAGAGGITVYHGRDLTPEKVSLILRTAPRDTTFIWSNHGDKGDEGGKQILSESLTITGNAIAEALKDNPNGNSTISLFDSCFSGCASGVVSEATGGLVITSSSANTTSSSKGLISLLQPSADGSVTLKTIEDFATTLSGHQEVTYRLPYTSAERAELDGLKARHGAARTVEVKSGDAKPGETGGEKKNAAMAPTGGIDFSWISEAVQTGHADEPIAFEADPQLAERLRQATAFTPVIIAITPLAPTPDPGSMAVH